MKRQIYIILVLSVLLTNCGEKQTSETPVNPETGVADPDQIQVTQAQFEFAKMTLGTLSEQKFPVIVKANGMIDVPPENRAVVNATMGGYIRNAPLLVGDQVNKGQLLLTLENPEFVSLQQEYMETHEQLSYLKSEYERQATMKAENITSQKSFLKAESTYKTAVARYRGLEKQLRMLNISPSNVLAGTITSLARLYAPISGTITKVNITKGSYVSPANDILEIVDNDHIHLELSVFEKDIMNIKKDQEIDFKIPEASDMVYKAEVHLVGTALEPNRTVKVHGHLMDEDSHNFLTGMFVEAEIVTGMTTGKALPSEAIVEIDNAHYVLALDSKDGDTFKFKQIEVRLSASYDDFSVVSFDESIAEDTQFLTKGAFALLSE